MPEDIPEQETAAYKMHMELEAVILRYSHEADVTCYEVLGALSLCQENLMFRMRKDKKARDEEGK